ncbi:MAG: cupin domain-containing protein, partial [Anaerolineaceae bacterium]|nr:cupin domain-containing protein [Anaerolineaceae bacterium]
VQFVVPAGVWQAGQLVERGRYALFGCTLAPGFTGSMYEGGEREELLANYPDRRSDILLLTAENAEKRMPEGFAK